VVASSPLSGQGSDEGIDTVGIGRRAVGFVLAPVIFAGVWLAPLDLPLPAHRLAAILALVVALWLSEALPMAITAFLGVALAVALGVAPAVEAFAPFADPLIFVFIGTFMLARAIFVHGLDRRFALAILDLPGVRGRPGRMLAAFALAGCLLSMWISNTATVAMLYPIALALLRVLEERHRQPAWAAALLLAASFSASVGGLATPVGTPPNLIGLGFVRRELAVDVPFFAWMLLGMPTSLLLLAVAVLGLRAEAGVASGVPPLAASVHAARHELGPWTRGQVNAFLAFAVTVFLWVLPGAVALLAGQDHPWYGILQRAVPEGVAALFGAILLFLLPTDLRRLEFTLSWSEAARIEWWIVFLYGGGIALGTLAFRTGLAEAIGRGLTASLGVESGLALLVLATALATLLSETTSNTASANMVVPVAIAVARAAGADPLLPAVGATLGASLGFMLPVSTPCNAIVYGSGRVPLATMARRGLVLDLVGIVVIVAVVATLGPLVLRR